MRLERALRATAILIAVLGLVDPAWSRNALVRPRVVVAHATEAERALATQVVDALARDFDVSRADEADAAAYVLVGADIREGWRPPEGAVVFAVAPEAGQAGVRILNVDAPSDVSVNSVASLQVAVAAAGTGDRDVTVALHVDGVRRQEVTARLTGAQTRVVVPVTFVPSRPGLARVRLDVSVASGAAASAEVAVEVTGRVWRVLVFDGRPTYASTFVRRALEADPRFEVVARSVTGRATAVQSGAAPPSLGDATALSAFDLVIVGAPDTLGSTEAAVLERYLRERQGAVVVLPEGSTGVLVPQLTGIAAWRDERRSEAVRIEAADSAWTASEFVWPARWPALVTPVTRPASGGTADPPVWQMPIGGGRLVVSSAIDGWRSRADEASGYSAFWRLTAATAASATPSLVQVRLDERLVVPGATVAVDVQDLTSGDPTAQLVDATGMVSPVRLWPGVSGRQWQGVFRAPDVPGRYRLTVTSRSGSASGTAEFLVDDVARMRSAGEGNGLASIAADSHRGATLTADALAALPARLAGALTPVTAPQRWYPMRSVWWLAPFALAASGEWWLRRRRGLR